MASKKKRKNPNHSQCQANTQKGSQCLFQANGDGTYCSIHLKNSGNITPALSKKQIEMAIKENQTFTLRMAGANYADIADRVGYADASGAYRAFNRALNRLVLETPDEARLLELARLDAISINLFRSAQQGALGSVDRYLRVMERRSKLLGLDAPDRVEVDWRTELEQAGVENASEVFEEMVALFMKEDNDTSAD